MVTETSWVNPRMLRWAREQVGLSIEEVGELSRSLEKRFYRPINPQELRQWEEGQAEPDLNYLETLSEIYRCPIGYFLLTEPPHEAQRLFFRGLTPEKQAQLEPVSRQTLRRFIELAKWTVSVIEDTDIDWSVRVASYSEPIEPQAVVQAERQRFGFRPEIRNSWQSAEDAFLWWRRQIESLGVFCFQMPLDPRDFRGASIWLNNRYPFILVNHMDVESATGRLFTLLHEYAHLLTDREGLVCDFRDVGSVSSVEAFANRFAARMLISLEEVKEELRRMGEEHYRANWSDSLIDQLRKPFFVSRHVVAIALQDLKLAPGNFYEKKRQQWESRQSFGRGGGGRPSLKERIRRELGFALPKLLAEAYRREGVSLIDMADIIGTKVEKIEPLLLEWDSEKISK